jgi:hypothetical protein
MILKRAKEIVLEYSTLVTLRQLHYRLVSETGLGYPNTQMAYKGLSERTAKLRRERLFPALSDLTRSIIQVNTWGSPSEAIQEAADIYARDLTEGQKLVPVLVTEKATLTAQLYSWFGEPRRIMIVPLRGYSSESFDREILEAFDPERNYRVLYVGDHDPSGHDIERHAQDQLDGAVISWQRVALTEELVGRFKLPVVPGKASDSRSGGFVAEYGKLIQVEVEALAPDDLHDLIEKAIDATWDVSAFRKAAEQEQQEREQMKRLARP